MSRQLYAFSSAASQACKASLKPLNSLKFVERRDLKNLVPDYEVGEVNAKDIKKMSMTLEEVQKTHPLDYSSKKARPALEYGSQIGKNEFLIFNLPQSMTENGVKELCSVKGV